MSYCKSHQTPRSAPSDSGRRCYIFFLKYIQYMCIYIYLLLSNAILLFAWITGDNQDVIDGKQLVGIIANLTVAVCILRESSN